MTEQRVFLGLGSNLGDRIGYLRSAVRRLEEWIGIDSYSMVYQSAAMYLQDQPRFCNSVVSGKTNLTALELISLVSDLERAGGRQPRERFGPREIDIDILLLGQQVVREPGLIIPHPRLCEREFVLAPLVWLAADNRHPECGATFRELLDRLVGSQAPSTIGDAEIVCEHLARNYPCARIKAS